MGLRGMRVERLSGILVPRRLVWMAVVIAAVLSWGAHASAAAIPGHYIVVLRELGTDPGTVAGEHARDDGAKISHIYRNALRGFAAAIPDQRLDAVKADPRVAYVS